MTLSKVKVTELDFEANRDSLKAWLKTKPEFSAFDFEGSNMAQQLNILAMNNNYMSHTANFNGNEAFLESSQLRTSVVSNASPLGYVPRSMSSPLAIVDIVVTPPVPLSAPATLTLERGKKLSAIVEGTNYVFSVTEVEQVTKVNDVYTFTDIVIREGVYVTNTFTVADGNRKFVIPNNKIDTGTLTITVQNSDIDYTTREFKYAHDDNILTVNDESLVYFLNEVEDGKFQLEFGDGVLGKQLDDGNIIIAEYISTNGDEANSASSFDMTNSINDFSNIVVTTKAAATGGADRDDEDTIKFLAPREFESQGSAVSPSDYTTLVYKNFKDAETVTSWGGEENEPPVYGSTFTSIKPFSGDVLPDAIKDFIVENIMKPKRVSGITPVIIDPEYTNIIVNTEVEYDPTKTTFTEKQMIQAVSDSINLYSAATLEKFFGDFKYSNLACLIDAAEPSILSNHLTLSANKKITPKTGTASNYVINFKNPIDVGTVVSTKFSVVDCTGIQRTDNIYYLSDDGLGNINVSYQDGDIVRNLIDGIGTVDYENGKISINSITILGIEGLELEVSVGISKNNIDAIRNEILRIESKNITITKNTNV